MCRGKRKSSKKPQTRIKQVLDKSFRCLFCSHQGSVTCKMDNKTKIGRLDCKDCGQTFTMDINHLSEPVDVYSAWIDACEEANPVDAAPPPRARAALKAANVSKKRRNADSEDDEAEREPQASDEDEDDLPDIRPGKKRKEAVVSDEEEEDAAGEDDD